MSESSLPPAHDPPPAPPADLTAGPPGASVSGRRLRRVQVIGRTARILVAMTAGLAVLSLLTSRLVADEARAFLDGELDRTDFVEAAAPNVLVSFVQGIALIASAATVMVWMYRMATNLRTLHRGTTWGPGWAVAGWLLPPFLFVLPFLVLRELWRASDPDTGIGESWRSTRAPAVATVWFVLFGPVQTVLQFAVQFDRFGTDLGGLGGEEALAEQIATGSAVPIVSAVVEIAAAVSFVLLARSIERRHCELTGEGAA